MRLHELQPAVRATLRAPGRLLAVVVLLPILVAIAVHIGKGDFARHHSGKRGTHLFGKVTQAIVGVQFRDVIVG